MTTALDVVGNYASLLLTTPDFVEGVANSTEVLAEALLNSQQVGASGLGGAGGGAVAMRPTFLSQVLPKVDDEQLAEVVNPLFRAILQKLRPAGAMSKAGAGAMASTKALVTLLSHKSTVRFSLPCTNLFYYSCVRN